MNEISIFSLFIKSILKLLFLYKSDYKHISASETVNNKVKIKHFSS